MIKAIHQVLPTYSKKDAIGSDTFLIRASLQRRGIRSEIYFEEAGDTKDAMPISELEPHLDRADTAIMLHFSIGSHFPGTFVNLKNYKIVRYHNVTPPQFFVHPEEAMTRAVCMRGRQQIPMLATFADLILADSKYNAGEFDGIVPGKSHVLPIFRNYEALSALPPAVDLHIPQKPLILFVGRISPNKAQHDLLKLLALYKATFKQDIGLVLVGGFFSQTFRNEIYAYAQYLGLKLTSSSSELDSHDVLVSGLTSDEELASWYRSSTLFCSMSEHEGFGVPLVEAMHFGLPIFAHRAAAVPETLGAAGLIVDKHNWVDTLAQLRLMINDKSVRAHFIQAGQTRVAALGLREAEKKLSLILDQIGASKPD